MPHTPMIRAALTAFGATLAVAASITAAVAADPYAAVLSRLDTEVLLLFLPCCALLLAVIVEVVRVVAKGPIDETPAARQLEWNVLSAGK
jgi:hypothetical protein